MSLHFLKFSSGTDFGENILNSVTISGKYDDNSFGNNVININGSNSLISNTAIEKKGKKTKETNNKVDDVLTSDFYKTILSSIYQEKVPNNILAKILFDKNNIPSTEVLFFRGQYNATDAQVLKAKSAKEGASLLQQSGLQNMLNNVYFIVTQTQGIKKEYSKPLKDDTYSTIYRSYLFQVDLKDLLATTFWTDFWWDGADQSKYKNFMNFKFPVKLISVTDGAGLTTGKESKLVGLKMVETVKSQEQIYTDLANSTVTSALTDHANNYEPLKVKTVVFSTGPITAKIGKKEDLKIDDRFEVFENRESKSGEKSSTKMGYVRVSKVANNVGVADGNSDVSKFYKAPARGVDKNMILKELPETGIQVGVELVAFDGIAIPMVNFDYVTHLVKGNRLTASYMNVEGSSLFLTEVRQVLQLNKLSLTPGFGYIFALSSDGEVSEDPGGISASFKIGLEFGKHFQIQLGPRLLADSDGNMVAGLGFGLRLFGF